MHKKCFILIIAIIYSHAIYSGQYQAQGGYPAQHHPDDQLQELLKDIDKINQSDEDRKKVLTQEEEYQYFFTKLFAGGAALSTALAVGGTIFEKAAMFFGGCAGAAFSTIGAIVSYNNENYKAERRKEERKVITQRQIEYSKRKEELIHNHNHRQHPIIVNIKER